MSAYTRTTAVDSAPSGDTVKQAVVDVDTDLTGIVAAYNVHDTATTSVHGFTGAKTGSGALVGATSPTITTPTLTGAVTASGATITGGNTVNQTILTPTLTGTVTASGATITGGANVNMTITTPAITGGTNVNQTITTPTITGGTSENMTITTPTITGGTITQSTLNGLTHTAATTGFTLAGGTTSKTLTVSADTTLDEAVSMSSKAPKASPVFTGDVTAPTQGETSPGSIRGTNKEIFKTASADSPLTAAQCAGTIVSNYGMTAADCTIDLPTAVEGLGFVCILPTVQAFFFKLHCPTAQADKIYLLGVAGSDDGNVGVASGYATGAAASFFTFKASDGGYDWFCIPLFGTWVAS